MIKIPNSPWFSASVGLIGLIVGYAFATGMDTNTAPVPSLPTQVAQRPAPSKPPPAPSAKNVKPVDKNVDHIRGNPDATVSVIEYSDFECPFCAKHHPTMKQVVETYGDDVNWVFRHFPLGFHPNAQMAAEASECANDQGGNDSFWQYADLLFDNGVERVKGKTKNDFVAYAEEIDLDADDFLDCLDSGKFTQHVKDDMVGGSAAGVSGTPGNIVINNKTKESKLASGAQPLSSFKAIIDPLLK